MKARIASRLPVLPDVGVVAVLVGDVRDDLDAAVGQRHAVLALSLVAVTHLKDKV